MVDGKKREDEEREREEKFATSGVFCMENSSVGLANLGGSTSRDEGEQTFMVSAGKLSQMMYV